MKATRASKCSLCQRPIRPGVEIIKYGAAWVHVECRDASAARLKTLNGETFRGTGSVYRRKIKRE